jgi:peptidase YpeB-like protein
MKSKTLVRFLPSLTIAIALGLSSAFAGKDSQEQLKAKAKITQAEAEKTALAKVPTGKIKATELEMEKGRLIWSIDMTTPGTKNITEVEVDAKTGKIVAVETETPEQQAREAAEKAKEKKSK